MCKFSFWMLLLKEHQTLMKKKHVKTTHIHECLYCGIIIVRGGPIFVAFVGNPCP